ncbi:hypothetical protein JMJ77_0005791 [Colletotrichum scovillei]|uniref:Uncharacterized protein n=1 Tax=Colletotrichum scovillei TaxID=1209932 RepID=A0A9P7RKP8_9PEZI|nr:hypothetical protein JMJ77_0005791 [Colletotrichum scovillei]KAG7077050.1 hypothetical protein JMJ76_0014304 [Colletotrichum scovillei]KAG7084134.1 hypothetical protein JMJ78_0009573 [Colletotrichum scovillei]
MLGCDAGVTPVSWGGSSYDGWGAVTTFRSWSTGSLITNSIPLFELDFSPTHKSPLASESNVEFGRITDILYDGETGQDNTDEAWQTRNATDAENAGELAYPQRRAWVQGAEKISISSHDHDFQPLVSDKRALISDEPPRTGLVGVESAVGLARGVTVAHGRTRLVDQGRAQGLTVFQRKLYEEECSEMRALGASCPTH